MNNLTETQKAYIAGFLDGEGCITIYKRIYNEGYQPQVIITNSNKELLEQIKYEIGIGTEIKGYSTNRYTSGTYNGKYRSREKITYRLIISDRNDIADFIFILLKYIRLKKRQAELILEFINLKLILDRGTHYPDEDIIYSEIRKLNKTGVDTNEL